MRHGFPDLLLIGNGEVRFVEIKAENDQLRRNQMIWLQQLREAGFRADVVRVRWVVDPAQPYVVVDVETTGGRGEGHRVTAPAASHRCAARSGSRCASITAPFAMPRPRRNCCC